MPAGEAAPTIGAPLPGVAHMDRSRFAAARAVGRLLSSRFATAVVAGALVMAVVGAGVGFAVTSGSSNQIDGCYKKSNGNLRIASSCKPGELAISWNQQGPDGADGPKGATGAKGATGTTG